jgi:hypothetical protein
MTLTKLNSSGGFVWTTPVQGSVVNTAPQCLLDTAENLYVGITAFGPSRIALSSYTSSGAFRFTTPIGITSEVRALAMDSAGELILGGTGGATIAKISQAGVVQWATSTGFGTEIRRIACDASGNSYALIDGTRLQQFTASGAPGWNAMLPFSSAGNGYEDVAVDHQGAVIVTGHPLVASSPFVTRRYLANGNLLWERSWTAPGHTSSVPLFVEIDAAGNSVVSGRASVLVGATLVYDGAYASYTPAGDLRWSGLVSSGGRQINARALALDADSTFALVGEVMTVPTMGPALPQLHATHLRAQSIAFCFGDGSGAACPCGNVSPPGDQAGCTNAVGLAAHLADGGIASVTNDTLVLTSTNETPAGATLFIQGSSSIAPALFGDGLRCVGGSVKRLYTKVAVGGVVSAPQSGDASITARSAAQSDALVSGSTRFYQAYYRDPNSGFCPAPAGNTWNMSNGLIVTWAP